MSVQVSTCTRYDPSALTLQLYGNCGADKTCVFLSLVAKMINRFLEQRISIKFRVKLGNNASDTCAMLSEAYDEKLWKSQMFLSVV